MYSPPAEKLISLMLVENLCVSFFCHLIIVILAKVWQLLQAHILKINRSIEGQEVLAQHSDDSCLGVGYDLCNLKIERIKGLIKYSIRGFQKKSVHQQDRDA